MTDSQTTGSGASGDAEPTQDYRAKYDGLMSAFSKRTNEFTAREQSWQTERAEYEARLAKLAEYEARDAEATEEQNMEEEYERLRERFDPDPTPLRHNESRTSGTRREPKRDHTAPWPT